VTILVLTMTTATVIYSVVDAVAIRPLPYGAPDRLVAIFQSKAPSGALLPTNPAEFLGLRELARVFEGVGAARVASLSLELDGVVETVTARMATANLFAVLGVQPAIGRFFGPAYERPGGPDGVILTHQFWRRRFAGDPRVIGRLIKLGPAEREVIGVLPEGVWYPINAGPPPELYVPYVITSSEQSNSRCCVFAVGRLRPGVTVEQAQAAAGTTLVLSLHDQVVGPAKASMLLVLAAVGLLLLVACVNVANLLLARAATRMTEVATRQALGASRHQLVMTLLVEGVLLSLSSAVIAVALSIAGVQIASAMLPEGLTRADGIAVNARVLTTVVVVAASCGLLFSTAPAWRTSRVDLLSLIKSGGGPISAGRRATRALSAFLVADVAFVALLLVGTALVVTTYIVITGVDLGFERRNVMSIWFQQSVAGAQPAERAAAVETFREVLMDRARAVPGVTEVAIVKTGTPMSGTISGGSVTIPGIGRTDADGTLETRVVTHDYFRVMGMQLIRGRLFDASDRLGTPQVLLLNDVAARRFFPDREAVGQPVTLQGPATIIGVLKGVRADGPEADPRPELYQLLDQEPYRDLSGSARLGGLITVGALVVRTAGEVRTVAPTVREAIRPAVTLLPSPTRFVDDDFHRLTVNRRISAGLMAAFGLIAVAIGALGVYGTMAFLVTQRTRAIGLRMALGASPARVVRVVLQDATRRVVAGAAIGLAVAWGISEAFHSFVFGIRPTEPLLYGLVAAGLTVVGLSAALVPALRAARVDPLITLRSN
jgi:predicted permease